MKAALFSFADRAYGKLAQWTDSLAFDLSAVADAMRQKSRQLAARGRFVPLEIQKGEAE
jgi:hypothetical protein